MTRPSLLAAALLVAGTACAANPDAGVADPRSIAVYDLAREEFGKGKLRESLARVNEALEIDPNNADAAYLGAIVHLAFCARDERSSDCRFEDAERFARRALEANPEMRDATNTLGVVLTHEKKYDEAISVLRPLTEDILYGSPEKSWGNLGLAYLESGRVDEAIDALRRAVAVQPVFCVGNYRLGLAHEKKGDFEGAKAALTRALETDRKECQAMQEAWEARARVAVRLGAVDDARTDYQRCAQLSKLTPVGERCQKQLAALGGPVPKSEPGSGQVEPPKAEPSEPQGGKPPS